MQKLALLIIPAALTALVSAGCSSTEAAKKPVAKATQPTAAQQQEAKSDVKSAPVSTVAVAGAPDAPLYFDFDSEQLRPESQDMLKQVAEYLKKTPAAKITISGHADDQGTSEYNMALGDKRALAARSYLQNLGVEQARIQTVSYGEEKPAIDAQTDDARAKNRRDELDVVVNGDKSASN